MNQKIDQKLEEMHNVKFNRKPIEKKEFLYSDGSRDDYKLSELTNFLKWEKNIIKFVDWTTNIIYLRTDVQQPLYLTDPENHAKTLEDRFPISVLED